MTIKERAAGNTATGDKFFSGYEVYIESLETKLEKGSHNLLAIFGARRIGKTSCVKEYFRRLENKTGGNAPIGIYIDVEKISDPKDLIDKIISRIEEEAAEGRPLASKLKGFKKKYQEKIAEWIPGFKGSVGGEVTQGAISTEVTINKYSFDKTIEFLRDELRTLERPVFIALDELPDSILRIKKKYDAIEKADSKEVISTMLSSLRTLTNEGNDKCKLIFLGSSNIIKTLVEIGIEEKVNTRDNLNFYPMSHSQAYGLFKEICDVGECVGKLEKFKNSAEVEEFFKNFFTLCTPSDVQYFADALINLRVSHPDLDIVPYLRRAYIALQVNDRGASYYENRLKEYYDKKEETLALKVLQIIAAAEFNANSKLPKRDLVNQLKKVKPEEIFSILKHLQRDMLIEEDENNCLYIYNKPFSFYLYNMKNVDKPWNHKC